MTELKMFASLEEESALLETRIKALSGGTPQLAILEAGCGRCWPLNLDGIEFKLTGVDLDQQALRSRQDLDEAIVGDLRYLDFGERAFDVVYSCYVLEHVQNAKLVLENLYRWLKPGGLLLLKLPDRNTAFGLVTRLTPLWVHVVYYKYVRRYAHAGEPGYGPYPTYYDEIVSRDGVRDFCASHGLAIRDEYGSSGFEVARHGTKITLLVAKVVSAFSMGRFAWRHNNLTYVLTKPSAPRRSE